MLGAVDTTPRYAVALIVHVALVLVAGLQLAMAIREAGLLAGTSSAAALSETQRRYYASGSHVFARLLYLVPVSGFVLVAMSEGTVHLGEPWVLVGLAAAVVALVHLEVGVLRGEATVRRALDHDWRVATEAARRVVAMGRVAAACMVLAAVVMVLQPS